VTTWAFVSDIHGNRGALDRAEQLAREAGATRFACLGDVIGRGDPEGCVAWVRDHAELAIVGNRDLDYLDRVSPDLQSVVRSWPHEAQAEGFVLSHGDPHLHQVLHSAAERDGFRRVFRYLEERGARLWLFGHTHRSRRWALHDGYVESLADEVVEIDDGTRFVVNVGTTGLPLPGRDAPSFVVYDDARRRLQVVGLPRTRTTSKARQAILTERQAILAME
jgi:predicted phosphodiesterase